VKRERLVQEANYLYSGHNKGLFCIMTCFFLPKMLGRLDQYIVIIVSKTTGVLSAEKKPQKTQPSDF